MHYAAWLLIANCAVAYTEYQYRCGDYDSFYTALPYIIAPIILAQLALFYGFRGAPSLFYAGAVFSLCNVLFRIINSFTLHEHLNFMNWMGVACIVASVFLLRVR